jgi:adenine-specific DNA-methyltransferase
VAPQRSVINKFGYNDCDWYASGDVYFISEKSGSYDLFTLLGLLNSDLYLAWFYLRGKRKGEMMELYQMPLMELPLPKLSKDNSKILDAIGAIAKSLWARNLDTGETDVQALNELNAAVMKSFGFGDSDLEELKKWKAEWQLKFIRGVETSDLEEADQAD